MQLDRDIPENQGRGKYALINLRTNTVQWGDTPDEEFFVIKLKDQYAAETLLTYALQAQRDDPEYARAVLALSEKARNHPHKKMPD